MHSTKVMCIRGISGPYFPALGLNMEIYKINICIPSKCRKIQTRKTPNTDKFHAVMSYVSSHKKFHFLLTCKTVLYFINFCLSLKRFRIVDDYRLCKRLSKSNKRIVDTDCIKPKTYLTVIQWTMYQCTWPTNFIKILILIVSPLMKFSIRENTFLGKFNPFKKTRNSLKKWPLNL